MRRQIVSTWKWVENNKSPLGNLGSVAACTSPPLPALPPAPVPPRPSPSLGSPGQGSVTPSPLSDVRRRSQVCVCVVEWEGAAAGRWGPGGGEGGDAPRPSL